MKKEFIYQSAWERVAAKIQTKTGWGKNEILKLMQDNLLAAYEAATEAEEIANESKKSKK